MIAEDLLGPLIRESAEMSMLSPMNGAIRMICALSEATVKTDDIAYQVLAPAGLNVV